MILKHIGILEHIGSVKIYVFYVPMCFEIYVSYIPLCFKKKQKNNGNCIEKKI
ncbi:MAG: hypothetical protein RIS64_2039 [Bacteroidota bacterium]|jgi:hypothetical protein